MECTCESLNECLRRRAASSEGHAKPHSLSRSQSCRREHPCQPLHGHLQQTSLTQGSRRSHLVRTVGKGASGLKEQGRLFPPPAVHHTQSTLSLRVGALSASPSELSASHSVTQETHVAERLRVQILFGRRILAAVLRHYLLHIVARAGAAGVDLYRRTLFYFFASAKL